MRGSRAARNRRCDAARLNRAGPADIERAVPGRIDGSLSTAPARQRPFRVLVEVGITKLARWLVHSPARSRRHAARPGEPPSDDRCTAGGEGEGEVPRPQKRSPTARRLRVEQVHCALHRTR